jgi:hypothetical protein
MKYDFEPYRKKYPLMTFKEKQQFYIEQELLFPDQSHWNKIATNSFFNMIKTDIRVLEFGGWKGDTAHNILPNYDIKFWDNYELCPSCIEKSICKHPNYNLIIPIDYTWNTGYLEKNYNVLYSVHAIEHISNFELIQFIATIPKSIQYIYIESPLKDDENNWTGRNNAHVLQFGWNYIIKLFESYGFKVIYNDGDVKWLKNIR